MWRIRLAFRMYKSNKKGIRLEEPHPACTHTGIRNTSGIAAIARHPEC